MAALRIRKPTFWRPLVGVALVVAAALVTSILFQVGLAPMHERNDRTALGEASAETAQVGDPLGDISLAMSVERRMLF
ncbi:hypothetical protein [Microbacterium sp. W4I20]|uniref:hypothetical protein n=1 Tax=Microbacterium sp. W4I20 TaxID=3042262 RepID=UPI00278A1C06|nr:hypothetical protein [Microbacterium sp. W4I20]MDQ0726352.1 hypothetical protein [Microbacterium sp. W4I20]